LEELDLTIPHIGEHLFVEGDNIVATSTHLTKRCIVRGTGPHPQHPCNEGEKWAIVVDQWEEGEDGRFTVFAK